MGQLVIKKSGGGKTLVLVFQGPINEDAVFPDIETDDLKKLDLNLEKVTSINSCGIREWVLWMKKLPKTLGITLKQCPYVVVHQMNIINGFISSDTLVESFYVPYFCQKCEENSELLVDRKNEKISNKVKIPSTIPCKHCKKKATPDVDPSTYLRFLENTKQK